jgi:hypothetical protein
VGKSLPFYYSRYAPICFIISETVKIRYEICTEHWENCTGHGEICTGHREICTEHGKTALGMGKPVLSMGITVLGMRKTLLVITRACHLSLYLMSVTFSAFHARCEQKRLQVHVCSARYCTPAFNETGMSQKMLADPLKFQYNSFAGLLLLYAERRDIHADSEA